MLVKENRLSKVRWEKRDNDGWHLIVADNTVVLETPVETLARITYEETVAERDPARRRREAERAHFDIHASRWEGFGVRSTKNQGRGGKGGRGGV